MSPTPIPNSQEVPKLHLKSTLESLAGVVPFKIFFPGLSIWDHFVSLPHSGLRPRVAHGAMEYI